MPVDLVRDAAIDVLLRIIEKDAHISQAIDRTLKRKKGRLSARGSRFMSRLVYGTTRHAMLADYILKSRLKKPPETLPLPVLLILRMGVFQALFCDNVTFPAMVHTSVDLAKKRSHIGLSRLVNAVLKRIPESLEEVELPDPEASPIEYLSIRYSLPDWLVEGWSRDFGAEAARDLCEACDSEAPRTLRVNTHLNSRDELLATLEKAETPAVPHPDVPDAVLLPDSPIPFNGKAFQRGLFFVQDAASMVGAHLLEPVSGETVLDMCAAPGGKSTHIAEIVRDKALIVSNDRYFNKMRRIRENTERLGLESVRPVVSDAEHPPFAPGFDRVLLDAPCSGLGTLRRRPDLKWRIRPEDPERLAQQQRRLLRSACDLCKNGGLVVYSVCTFTPEETEQVVASVLGEVTLTPEDGPAWISQWKISQGMYRILPQKGGLDGYFLARLRKA